MKASAYHKKSNEKQPINREEHPSLYLILPFIFSLAIILFLSLSSGIFHSFRDNLFKISSSLLSSEQQLMSSSESAQKATALQLAAALDTARITRDTPAETPLPEPAAISLSDIAVPEHGEKFGTISSDHLGLNLPLFYGDTNAILKQGAGMYEGSKLPGSAGQTIICAHNTAKYFGPLEHAETGDIIHIQTSYAEYDYEIAEMKVASMYDTSTYDLDTTEETLILYTCYPFYGAPGKKDRLFIYAKRIAGPSLIP